MGRVDRVAEAIKREISNIIHDELKDPRIGFVTITRAEITQDLRYAKIFYSILGSAKEEDNTQKAIESAKGFIKKLIGDRIKLRFTPELSFHLDKSAEYSQRIQEQLDKIKELENESKKSHRRNKRK